MNMLNQLPFEWLIGLRYTRAGKRSSRNGFLSFLSLISMCGIALGVAALIVVLSVMNGFQKEVTDRMLSVLPHIEVFDTRGALPDWQASAAEALRNPAVKAAAPFIDTQGMLTRGGDALKPALVRGVLPAREQDISAVLKQVKSGSFQALKAGEFNIVLGVELARALEAQLGDSVTMLMAPAMDAAAGAPPRRRAFTVVGIFEAGHNEFDSSLAFIHIDDAMALLGAPAPAGLRLSLHDLHQAQRVAAELKTTLTGQLYVRDWSKLNANWFAAVQTQKHMMFIILTMIIAVAAFNLVSTLVMTVTDKQADIAILRTLGASPSSIMKIFMVQGALVGVLGAGMGVLGGAALALNVGTIVPAVERLFGFHLLDKQIYFISSVPSDVQWGDIGLIGLVAVGLAFLATVYPSWAASRVRPAEALRYE